MIEERILLAAAWAVFAWFNGFVMMYFFKDFMIEFYNNHAKDRMGFLCPHLYFK